MLLAAACRSLLLRAWCVWLSFCTCFAVGLQLACCCLLLAADCCFSCLLLFAACLLLAVVCCCLLQLVLATACSLLAACALLLTLCCACCRTCFLPLAALAALGACRLRRLLGACTADCCLLFAACFFVNTRQLMRHTKPDPAILADLAASDPRHTRRAKLVRHLLPPPPAEVRACVWNTFIAGRIAPVHNMFASPERKTLHCRVQIGVPTSTNGGITDLLKGWSLKPRWRHAALRMTSRWCISRLHVLPLCGCICGGVVHVCL